MKILETDRLILRNVVNSDAEFVLDLLNQPSFIKFIGDRKVRTIDQAENYIETRFTKSYEDFGFGMYLVELKEEFNTLTNVRVSASESKIQNPKSKIGICGFIKRDNLPDADIGFAFLPQFEKKGYAFESADAVMKYGKDVLGLQRVLAITTQDNESSGRLLEKIGFKFERLIKMPNDEELKLFSTDL